MIDLTISENFWTISILKYLFQHGKTLGLVFFKITDRGHLEISAKTMLRSILLRAIVIIIHMCLIRSAFATKYAPEFIPAIHTVHVISIVGFTLVFTVFEIINHKEFIKCVNMTIDALFQISEVTKSSKIFSYEFVIMFFVRLSSNLGGLATDLPRKIAGVKRGEMSVIVQYLTGYFMWFGIVAVVDLMYLVFVSLSGMYSNIGIHLECLVRRYQHSPDLLLSNFHRKSVIDDFCMELDKCSEIYSKIFKITCSFQFLLQFCLLFMIYFDIVMTIGCLHMSSVLYLTTGAVSWNLVLFAFIQIMDFLLLMLLVDLTVRRSRIPLRLNWQSLNSDVDEQWDQCVEKFLYQLKLEELQFGVYGLFQINNDLCLKVFSFIVAYLTILIQFSMSGLSDELVDS